MSDKVELARPFVNEVLHFFRKQITELAAQPDLVESLEVAVQCLEAIYRLPAEDIDAQGGRVDVYELFENARSIVPEEKVAESEHLKNEGNRLMKEEKYQEALQMYTRAINIDPRNPIFYCNRAAAWIRLGDYDKSISDANQSLRYNPRYSKAFVRLGDTYYRMNKFREAANEYQKAIEIEPDNEDYKNKLTMAMQRSLTALQANTNLPPNDPFVNMMSQVINDPGMQQLLPRLQQIVSEGDLANIGGLMRNMMQNPEALMSSMDGILGSINARGAGGNSGDNNNSQPDNNPNNAQ